MLASYFFPLRKVTALQLLKRDVQRIGSVRFNVRLDSNPFDAAILYRIVICDGDDDLRAE
ncbi:MAG: hypothetical protein QNK34_08000 [Woeseiaceae bacterium]|nr:hypothetical protein [Woeseiaceae bacterium]